jgi:DNA-binding NarL/FixJ family response regulator
LVEIGGAPMSPRIARKALDLLMHASVEKNQVKESSAKKEIYSLSDRETEVLHLLIDGYTYRTIAEKLFLSTHTVRKHIANIYEKLHVTSKAQAIKIATNDKLV